MAPAHRPSPTRLRLRVAPGAARSAIVGRHGDGWKIRVVAAPERGKANDEVVALLAGSLGIGQRDVRVVTGHAARDKVVEVRGIALAEAERRLSAIEVDRR